jgi:hypothetical protein
MPERLAVGIIPGTGWRLSEIQDVARVRINQCPKDGIRVREAAVCRQSDFVKRVARERSCVEVRRRGQPIGSRDRDGSRLCDSSIVVGRREKIGSHADAKSDLQNIPMSHS